MDCGLMLSLSLCPICGGPWAISCSALAGTGGMAHWQALSRGGVRMMIGHCPDAMLPAQTGDHSDFANLHVDDVDALHAEFVQRGAIIRQPPSDRPWGMREMAVATMAIG